MVDQIDEVSNLITITVIYEGQAHLTELVYPSSIPVSTPFTITYKVTNNSQSEDILWGGLYTAAYPGGVLVTDPVTYWNESVPSGNTIDRIISFPTGITVPIIGYELRVGHQV